MIRKNITFLLVIVFLFGAYGLCGPLPKAEPEEVGMSAEKLNHITEVMQKPIEEKRMAGMVAVAARQRRIVYFEALGEQDMEKGIPMRKDSIFWIASMTKPITSVAVMMLYEEGKFTLDEPVSNYLPVFKKMKVGVVTRDEAEDKVTITTVDVEREVTIRDLLCHTSGLGYGWGDSELDKLQQKAMGKDEDVTLAEWIERLKDVPLKFQPGTKWEYGISTDVLGRLVEVASGMTLDKFFEERIFKPLGMKDTAFYVPEDKRDRRATIYAPAYEFEEDKGESKAEDSDERDMTLRPASFTYLDGSSKKFSGGKMFSGGGGLMSTAGDYLRFCQMMLNNGELDGVRILKKDTVELMTRNPIVDIHEKSRKVGEFGLGFGIHDGSEDGPCKGAYSWGGAAGTGFCIDPEKELVTIFMIQILPDEGITFGEEFRRLVYEAIVD